MKTLIIADPLSRIRPAGDTTLVLAVEAKRRGHQLWWAEARDVALVNAEVLVDASPITSLVAKTMPVLGEAGSLPLTDFDVVLIRKDPPFDSSYIQLCWLLQPYERQMVISNRPSLLLRFHEKMVPYEAMRAGALKASELVPTCLAANVDVLRRFLERHHTAEWIVKPWMGHGGLGVQKLTGRDAVLAIAAASKEPILVQPFLPEVVKVGDRRVFFVGGQYVGDVVRLPKDGGFVSNLSLGGTGELRPMDAPTRDRCDRLGKFLGNTGFDFVGADVIGHYITEANVTSPTGIVTYNDLGGDDISRLIIDCVERRK